MKKVYLLLLAAGMFTFVACNEGGGNSEGDATEAEEVVEETTEAATEEVAVEEVVEVTAKNSEEIPEPAETLEVQDSEVTSKDSAQEGE